MSAWKYKRVMPKVLVDQLRLIRPRDMIDLVGRPADHVYSVLAKTSYQKEISQIPTQELDSFSLERALFRNFVRTLDAITLSSPKDVRMLLTRIAMKFEASSLKAILRTKSAGLDADRAMEYIVPVGRLDENRCTEIIRDSENVHDVVESLSGLEYGRVLDGALEDYDKAGAVFPLEVALDRYVYSRIWNAARKLRGLDGRIARTILGLEIDAMNIKVVLKFKEAAVSQDQAVRYFIPVSDAFGPKELKDAVQAKEAASSLQSLLESARANLARDHYRLLMELIEEYKAHKSLSGLETVLDRGLLKTSLRMLKRYTPFFNIGLVLAFLNSKWFEVRNLRTIVRAAEEKMPAAKTRELLILPA